MVFIEGIFYKKVLHKHISFMNCVLNKTCLFTMFLRISMLSLKKKNTCFYKDINNLLFIKYYFENKKSLNTLLFDFFIKHRQFCNKEAVIFLNSSNTTLQRVYSIINFNHLLINHYKRNLDIFEKKTSANLIFDIYEYSTNIVDRSKYRYNVYQHFLYMLRLYINKKRINTFYSLFLIFYL